MNPPKYALLYKNGNSKDLLTVSVQGLYDYHTLMNKKGYPIWTVDYPEHAEMIRTRDDIPKGHSFEIPTHEFASNELEVVELTDYRTNGPNIFDYKINPINVALPTCNEFLEYIKIHHPDYANTVKDDFLPRHMLFSPTMELVKKKHSIKEKMKEIA